MSLAWHLLRHPSVLWRGPLITPSQDAAMREAILLKMVLTAAEPGWAAHDDHCPLCCPEGK